MTIIARFRSVSSGFVRFRSVSWKRATPLIPIVTNADATGGAKRNKKNGVDLVRTMLTKKLSETLI